MRRNSVFEDIKSKIIRGHPGRDESDSGRNVVYADDKFVGINDMKSCVSPAYRR